MRTKEHNARKDEAIRLGYVRRKSIVNERAIYGINDRESDERKRKAKG